jgi:DNA adenine methylase
MALSPAADAPARPFLKWLGGKRSLLQRLLRHVPKNFATYHEPFVGGGALFFALRAESRFRRARLNDANERLMRTYGAIQKDPEGVIRRLRRMPNDEAFFLKTRARDIDREVHAAVAAWMIYLNRTCFNGLYRVNKEGRFNAPFGSYANPRICDEENLRAAHRALEGVKLSSGDFRRAMLLAKPGDLVYCDPPYLLRTGREFTSYQSDGFTYQDHVRLRDTALALKSSGVRVMITNAGTEEVRDLYAGFDIEEVGVHRSVAADGFVRGKLPDFIIT